MEVSSSASIAELKRLLQRPPTSTPVARDSSGKSSMQVLNESKVRLMASQQGLHQGVNHLDPS
ncbi:hypothetical protein E2562_018812 [Oryza meyeriana var. granulata]|uniref:Uncharacterized protein n=1 Tax=Oryza meyeriana var. granulata TaxID=110450 RepID=A0A6G1F9M8_9ORYZ|nr:hypothetical protein E2562_018812 [Oryza meyeriana var. granulata]